ncbi:MULTISPECIES: hypothetical protein [unclassified Mycobacterium]|uniref:hypothetical protein n=1 Tax=unclassified Mycobacterium TaxID=2642494 RepID=UPI0029C8E192|nr:MULTISPECIES: hypothetical protein [unclassified Mycobacterium]
MSNNRAISTSEDAERLLDWLYRRRLLGRDDLCVPITNPSATVYVVPRTVSPRECYL